MVCLFTFVNNGDLITGAAKMIFKVEFSTSFYSGRGQLLQADEVTTDSRTFWAFTSLEQTSDPHETASAFETDGKWQKLSAAAECGGVEVLTFWIKNEEWEEAGVLTMGQSAQR